LEWQRIDWSRRTRVRARHPLSDLTDGSTGTVFEPGAERWPGLIWGFDVVAGQAGPIGEGDPPAGGLRWLHVALADRRAQQWIEAFSALPSLVREVLLSSDDHPRALVDDSGIIACVLLDGGRGLSGDDDVVHALHFALAPGLVVTARHHPVKCVDEVRRRIEGGNPPGTSAAALDLLVGSHVAETNARLVMLIHQAQEMEDALADHDREPEPRVLQMLRRRALRIYRQTSGLHRVLNRLEEDEALPEVLLPPVERLVQRVAAIEGDVAALVGQERLLREELDARATQRNNQNLYILSIMTALLLPPTLIAGLFGMNTSGLPFAAGQRGTLVACILALLSTVGTYVVLRAIGFFGTRG
jgi:zinc transporter